MSGRVTPGEYFRAIEEEFVRRRGATLLLSPKDWALIGEWRETGIPLRIVLQGIANVFDAFERRAPRGRRVNSLSYCKQEVLVLNALYRSLRAAEAGRPADRTGAEEGKRAVARHLGRLLKVVREAMSGASQAGLDGLVAALARAAADLKRLRTEARTGGHAPQGLEAALRRLDDALLEAGSAAIPEEDLRATRDEIAAALAAASARMSSDALEVTRRALLANHLRRRLRLPRLTLFD